MQSVSYSSYPPEEDRADYGWCFTSNLSKPICYKLAIERSYKIIEELFDNDMIRKPNESIRDYITGLSKKYDNLSLFESYVYYL